MAVRLLILVGFCWEGVMGVTPPGIPTNHILLLSHPTRPPSPGGNSFFGFSHLFLPGSKDIPPSIIVSAPRGSEEGGDGGVIEEPGVIWKCFLGAQNETCRRIQFPISNGTAQAPGEPCLRKRCKWRDGSWLGMTLAGNGHRLLACAPKWQRTLRGGNPRLNGLCHLVVGGEAEGTRRLIPLGEPTNQVVDKFPVYSWAQAGFSGTLDKNGGIILGAPGVNAWNGTVIKYEEAQGGGWVVLDTKIFQLFYHIEYFGYSVTTGQYFEDGIQWTVSGAPRASSLMGLVLIFQFPLTSDDLWFPQEILQGDSFGSYFGYTLTSGDLNGDGLDELLIGAPFRSNPDTAERQTPTLLGDEGCVFIYSAKTRRKSFGRPETLCGVSPGSHFGLAIAILGDVNQDGFQDFGVGAPYENDGEGAVYIFHGRASWGISSKKRQVPGISLFAQKIRPSRDAGLSLQSFGISLSGGVDLDGNGTPDIGIGASQSASLVILRVRRVMTLENQVQLILNGNFVDQVPAEDSDLILRTCTRIRKSPNTATSQKKYGVMVKVTFDPMGGRFNIVDSVGQEVADFRRIGKRTVEFRIELNKTSTLCTEWNIKRLSSSTNERQVNPAEVGVHWSVVFAKGIHVFPGIREYVLTGDSLKTTGENFESFCSECLAEVETTGAVTFPMTLGTCSGGIPCKARFRLRVFFATGNSSPVGKAWRLGSERLSLVIDLENTGPVPGSPLVSLTWTPDSFLFTDLDPFCTSIRINTLECSVGILGQNQSERIRLSLEPFYAKSSTTLLQLSASLQSPPPPLGVPNWRNQSTGDDDPNSETSATEILLEAEADGDLSGSVNRVWLDENLLGKTEFSQTFQITLHGENRVEMDYNFWFPLTLEETPLLSLYHPLGSGCEVKGHYQVPLPFLSAKPSRLLSCANPKVTCLHVACTSRRLEPGDSEQLTFRFSLDPESFRTLMEETGVVSLEMESRAELRLLGDKVREAFGITTVEDRLTSGQQFRPSREDPNPFPIYFSGIVVGILAVLLLSIILYQFGFFERSARSQLLQRQQEFCWTYSGIYQPPKL